jgi:hypothetical protein
VAVVATFKPFSAAPPVTDQFNAAAINTSVWSLYSSLGDGSMSESGGHLQITAPAGNAHYPNTTGNTAIQVLQQVVNADFQVEAKFDSTPSDSSEGIMALQDQSNYIHCSVASNSDGVHPFSGFLSGSTITNGNYAADIGSVASYWLRLARSGNNWTCSVSTDGTNYSTVTSFSQALTLNQLGVWAGNWQGTAFTAQVDYFSNGFTTQPSPGAPVTDQFNATGVNTSVWSLFSSVGDGTLNESGGHLQIVAPAGNAHYPNTTGNTAIQALQQVVNADFQVEAKFDSTPSDSSEGIMALQDQSNYIHCSVASNSDGVHPFSGFLSGSTISNANYAADIGSAASYWLRLARSGNNWTCSVSTDGTNYSTVTSFSQALTLSQLGVWAGNWQGTDFTAQVDYFSNGFTSQNSQNNTDRLIRYASHVSMLWDKELKPLVKGAKFTFSGRLAKTALIEKAMGT